MIVVNKDFLIEIKEVLDIETEFDNEYKTLEYKIKCVMNDGELKLIRFLTHADKVMLKGNKLIHPIHKNLVENRISYVIEEIENEL